MKKLLIVGLIAGSMSAQADPRGALVQVLAGSFMVGGALISLAEQPQSTTYVPYDPRSAPQQTTVKVYPSATEQQGYEYTSRAPADNPRAEYLKECQRYGMSLARCKTIWDGPPLEEDTQQPVTMVFTHSNPTSKVEHVEVK
jgi:hypothetical protein